MNQCFSQVIEYALKEAGLRGDPLIEPAHLLLGVAREDRGVAAQVLRDLQSPPERKCRRCLIETLRTSRTTLSLSQATIPSAPTLGRANLSR
jgi:hypothetical protein